MELNEESLEQAIIQMRNAVDSRGILINRPPSKIIMPNSLIDAAMEMIGHIDQSKHEIEVDLK